MSFYSISKFIARYQETDRMGIIHHSVYPIWYEAARTDLIKKIGISYSKLEKIGVMLPLRTVNSIYYKPCYYEDEIKVKSFISNLTKTRLTISYEVYRNNTKVIVNKGHTEHIFTNYDLKPMNLQKHFPDIYQKFFELWRDE